MKHVYIKEVSYENFAGEEKTQKLHFHMTPREFADWMIDNMEESERMLAAFQGMVDLEPNERVSRETLMEVMKVVRLVCELSYGAPSPDGEAFSRPSTGYKFSESAAYDAFRIWLFENPEEIEKFLNTILNPEVLKEFAKKFPGYGSTEGLALNEDFSDLSDEDFQNLTQEQMAERYKKLLAAKGGHNSKTQ